MSSKAPKLKWGGLLLLEAEVEQWRSLGAKWKDQDDAKREHAHRQTKLALQKLSGKGTLSAAAFQKNRKPFVPSGAPSNTFRTSYDLDFSMTADSKPFVASKLVDMEKSRLKMPSMTLTRKSDSSLLRRATSSFYGQQRTMDRNGDEGDVFAWRVTDDVDRGNRGVGASKERHGKEVGASQTHACGFRRAYPHVTKDCENAERSRIAIFGGSCFTS
eukprot:TRINITY_DN41676_c0_g1_i1.p1 TRINITY_DN41676_c0_g1~~TRINITY_DN41676_c0_g1_i1.p1  ORF type:complete len:216 (-),score=50.66 TRINITY_DN41676_c0_g1_i1:95-742(-)